MKHVCLFLLAFPILSAFSQHQQVKWIEVDVTIDHADLSNTFLERNASTTCTICKENGEHFEKGRYVSIYNHGKDTVYYRGSAKGLGKYIHKGDLGFMATVSNMSQYYPVYPGRYERIYIDGYEDAESRTRVMDMVIDFRFLSRGPVHSGEKGDEKTFYVFFTANVTLKSAKKVFVISKPILHKGQLTDLLSSEKEQFVGDIDRQMEQKPEDLIEGLRAHNFQNVVVHYGKPYSTALLLTPSAVEEAIDAYKQSESSLLQGIADFDFFQLR